MPSVLDLLPPAALLFTLLAGGACVAGDAAATLPVVVAGSPWVRASVDSLTHGTVAGASWAAVVVGRRTMGGVVKEAVLATALGMLVDVDHFLMACSFRLQAALSLPRRPPFHATSLIPIIAVLLFCVQPYLSHFAWAAPETTALFVVAWLSHHVRDATRRGLWFWPLGSTPPLPTAVYLGTIALLPLAVRLMLVVQAESQAYSARNGTLGLLQV